jgi:hypothetical protein
VLEVTGPFASHADGTRTWPVVIGADHGTLVASPTQVQLLPSTDDQPVLAEVAVVAPPPTPSVTGPSGGTQLRLVAKLGICLDRGSVRVLANVVDATHGETKHEVLGGGDATAMYQRFVLAQTPLTYAPASGPTGVASGSDGCSTPAWHQEAGGAHCQQHGVASWRGCPEQRRPPGRRCGG